jgi:hypothetical protein
MEPTTDPQPEVPAPLLIVMALILMVVAAGGTYLWQHQKVSNLRAQLATTQSDLARVTVRSSSSTPGSVNLLEATAFVNSFYTSYVNAVKSSGNADAVIKNDGDANLAFYKAYYQHGFDPIICAQATPATVKATGVSSSNGVAVISVLETYTVASDDLTITAHVVDQAGLKIDSLTCPGTLGTLSAPPAEN